MIQKYPFDWAQTLSPREHEVAKLIIRGMSNKRIAEALQISDHTAKFHVANTILKIGANTRVEAAVKYALWLDKQPSKVAGVLSAVA